MFPIMASIRKKEAVEDALPCSDEEPGESEEEMEETAGGDGDLAAKETRSPPKEKTLRRTKGIAEPSFVSTVPVVAPKARAKATAKGKAQAKAKGKAHTKAVGKAQAKAKGKAKAKAKGKAKAKAAEPKIPAPSNPKRKQRKTGDPPLPVPMEKRDELKTFLDFLHGFVNVVVPFLPYE